MTIKEIQNLIDRYPALFAKAQGYGDCADCGGIGGLVYVISGGYDLHPRCLLSDTGILEDERTAYRHVLKEWMDNHYPETKEVRNNVTYGTRNIRWN